MADPVLQAVPLKEKALKDWDTNLQLKKFADREPAQRWFRRRVPLDFDRRRNQIDDLRSVLRGNGGERAVLADDFETLVENLVVVWKDDEGLKAYLAIEQNKSNFTTTEWGEVTETFVRRVLQRYVREQNAQRGEVE